MLRFLNKLSLQAIMIYTLVSVCYFTLHIVNAWQCVKSILEMIFC